MPEYAWISGNRQDSEYVSYNTQFKVTLQVNEYLLRDECIQNSVKDLRGLLKKYQSFDYFCKTLYLISLREF